jgi:hypothetical protein
MKKTLLIFGMLLVSNMTYAQCLTVKGVENKTENSDLSSKKFTFGVKQITEELLSEKFEICVDGKPIMVEIISIEAPSIGINIGPFMIKKKITEVVVDVILDDKKYRGNGSAKLSVKATFAELKDENLPFEKGVFASAIKKALQDAIVKM